MKTTALEPVPLSGSAADNILCSHNCSEAWTTCDGGGAPSFQGSKISNLFVSDIVFLCCRLIEGINACCLRDVVVQMKELYQAERQTQDLVDHDVFPAKKICKMKLISGFERVLTASVERSENGRPALVRQWLTKTLRLFSLGSLRTLLEKNLPRISPPQSRMPGKLPKDMWQAILSYLPAHEVFKNIRFICRSLFVMTLSRSYWSSMQTFTMNSFWIRQRCNWGPLLYRLEHVITLKIENIPFDDPTISPDAAPSSQSGPVEESAGVVQEDQARSDTPSRCCMAEFLCYISQHNTEMQLVSFELPSCVQLSCSLVEAISSKFPSLQCFSIVNASDLCDSVLRQILHSMNLKYLSIPGAYQISDSSFFGIGAKTGASLLSLNLQRSFITNRGLKRIVQTSPNIQHLNLAFCASINNEGLLHFADSCTSLVSLNLQFCFYISFEGLSRLVRRCRSLQSLYLNNCKNIMDDAVESIAKSCTNLRTLDLSLCSSITDQSLLSMAKHLRNLSCVGLHNCRRVTDAGFVALVAGCQSLTSINVDGISMLTDVSLRAVASNLPKIRELRLGASTFSDNAFEDVSMKCTKLAYLSITSLPLISDESLLHFVQRSSTLLSLRIQNCPTLTDLSLEQFALNSNNTLQSLMISNCPGFSERGISNLIVLAKLNRVQLWYQNFGDNGIGDLVKASSNINHLQELNLVNCPASQSCIEELRKSLPNVSATHVEILATIS